MTFPWYVASGAGLVSLAALAVTCYYILRARADRAQRDAAQAEAVSATDLASRLDASLQTLKAVQAKAATNDAIQAAGVSSASSAGAFLAGSTGGVPKAGSPGAPKGVLPATPGPPPRLYITGFARP